VGKTWDNFKTHIAAAHRQHKQMQGGSASTSGYNADNADVGQTEDQMAKSTIGDLANLAIATAAYCVVVATLTEANVRLARQLEERSKEVQEVKALLKKDRTELYGCRTFTRTPWKLVLVPWLQGRQKPHQPELKISQGWSQT
jgi:hypothetical protein